LALYSYFPGKQELIDAAVDIAAPWRSAGAAPPARAGLIRSADGGVQVVTPDRLVLVLERHAAASSFSRRSAVGLLARDHDMSVGLPATSACCRARRAADETLVPSRRERGGLRGGIDGGAEVGRRSPHSPDNLRWRWRGEEPVEHRPKSTRNQTGFASLT
jgi:AcrR family transcriptional regulator